MQDKNEPQVPFPDVSLIRGGPFHRFQEATRLVGPNRAGPLGGHPGITDDSRRGTFRRRPEGIAFGLALIC
jgi:hypothetical protein